MWYDIKAVENGRHTLDKKERKQNLEKNWKIFKKGIDKFKKVWYNIKAVRKDELKSTLKIEQSRTN